MIEGSGSSSPDDRAAVEWAASAVGWPEAEVRPLAGDASFRRYLRLCAPAGHSGSWILMISPPALKQKNEEFIAVAEILHSQGVQVPQLRALRRDEGWLLLSDLGDRLLLGQLRSDPDLVPALYRRALEIMLQIQCCPPQKWRHLEQVDRERACAEALRVRRWYCRDLLGLEASAAEWQQFERAVDWLAGQVAAQPQVLVHGDFHSRNLLLTGRDGIGVLDFQDAVAGPVALDLVSLLRDCYFELPLPLLDELLAHYHRRAIELGVLAEDTALQTLRLWFEQCGLQRHLRVLGTFARLHLRDGRDGYLGDLPLTLEYSLRACAHLPQAAAIGELLRRSRTLLMQSDLLRSC